VKCCNSLINQQTNIPVLKKNIFPVMFSTSMIWEAYHVVCWRIVVSNTYCVVFFVLCTPCCQFLWIVHFWLHLRYSLTFMLNHSPPFWKILIKHLTLIISPILNFILNRVLHFESTDACEMELHPLYITCFVHIFFLNLYIFISFFFSCPYPYNLS
jgi:hypothetical protein